jgi:hypothetical protein
MTPPPARRGWSFAGAAFLGSLFALGLVVVACGEDGVTPDCPPLTLYNVKEVYGPLPEAGPGASAEEIREIQDRRDELMEQRRIADEERAEGVDAECLTALGNVEASGGQGTN